MKVAIIGQGAIAAYVVEAIAKDASIEFVALICRPEGLERARQFAGENVAVVTEIDQLSPKPDLIVDCAGHGGLIQHGAAALSAGIDVVTISTGALADADIALQLEDAARSGGASLKLLSGAIGGVDVLKAAHAGKLDHVTYIGRKPPGGWKGSAAEDVCDLDGLSAPFTHFSGTAREAALKYPKNANVAATIALAGFGLDQTGVELIADPGAAGNIHEVHASGEFGEMQIRISGKALASNPRSSALAAMSVVAELRERVKAVTM